MDEERRPANKTGVISPLTSSPELEDKLREVIRRNTGIVTRDHQLSNLAKTIINATSHFGFNSTREFIDFIIAADADSVEMEFVISAVTVGESYFFRDMEQIEFIRDEWLPRIVERRRSAGDMSLRIWSAGASNGQELYSLAIILREYIEDIHRWNIHLLGTDINTDALSNSVNGRYGEWSFNNTDHELKAKYFTPEDGHFIVCPELKGMVKFSYLNLIDNNYPSILSETTAIDLILCRNVFMYLDRSLIGGIVDKFTASLSEGGVLLVGPSDRVTAEMPGLTLSRYANITYHRKSRGGAAGREIVDSLISHYTPGITDKGAAVAGDGTEALHKAPAGEASPLTGAAHTPEGLDPDYYARLSALDRGGRWDELTRAVDEHTRVHGPSEVLLSMKGKALANTGELRAALKACKKGIEADPSGKHSYFIKALVLIELDRVEEALETLRKVIYLDPYFIEAHFQIGMLQLRTNKRDAGIKSLKNALEITESGEPERFIHTSREMTYSRFVEVLKSEIRIYEK